MVPHHDSISKRADRDGIAAPQHIRSRFSPLPMCAAFGLLVLLAFLAITAHAQPTDRVGICYGSGASVLVTLAKYRDFYAAEVSTRVQ